MKALDKILAGFGRCHRCRKWVRWCLPIGDGEDRVWLFYCWDHPPKRLQQKVEQEKRQRTLKRLDMRRRRREARGSSQLQ